jgi:hypothetical protein
MSSGKRRVFGREFKLSAVKRIMSGERGRALSSELGVSANQLYKWCMHFRRGGAEALRPASRPRKVACWVRSCNGCCDGAQAHWWFGAQGRAAAAGTGFFSASLAASRGSTPAERRVWRADVYALITAMTSPRPQGELTVERMCLLAPASTNLFSLGRKGSTPRNSFAEFRESVRLKTELEAATNLRTAILGVVLREKARVQQDLLMAEHLQVGSMHL